jgi:hypothetical protein
MASPVTRPAGDPHVPECAADRVTPTGRPRARATPRGRINRCIAGAA